MWLSVCSSAAFDWTSSLQAARPTIPSSCEQIDHRVAGRRCGCEHKAASCLLRSFRYHRSFFQKSTNCQHIQRRNSWGRGRGMQLFASAHPISMTSLRLAQTPGLCASRGETVTNVRHGPFRLRGLCAKSKRATVSISDEAQ